MSLECRATRRLPVAEGRQAARVRIGVTTIDSKLVDISAGGCAVVLSAPLEIESGVEVEIQTSDGISLMRVERVSTIENQIVLGLRRIHDAPAAQVRVRRRAFWGWYQANRFSLLSIATCTAVVAIVFSLGFLGLGLGLRLAIDNKAQAWSQIDAPVDVISSNPTTDSSASSRTDVAQSSGKTIAERVGQLLSRGGEGQELHLPAAPAAWTKHLGLSQKQLQQLSSRWAGKIDNLTLSQLTVLPEQELDEILSVLTVEQSGRLTELLALEPSP